MIPCTLIGSDKGGVGKSLLAQIFVTAFDHVFEESARLRVVDKADGRMMQPIKVIEIDFQHRLRTLLGSRVDLSLNASAIASDMARDRNAGSRHFNKVYDMWATGQSMTDLGANVTTPLFSWALHNQIARYAAEDDIRFRFVSVTSPDDQALRSSFQSLKAARESLGEDTDLFLVLNDTVGNSGFRHFKEGDVWKRIEDMANASRVGVINLPFCGSELMEWARPRSYTIGDMLSRGPEIAAKMAQETGGDKLTARIQLREFVDWVVVVQEELNPLFAKPEERRAAG